MTDFVDQKSSAPTPPLTCQPLPRSLKLGYGVGNLGLACVMNAATFYLLIFYTDVMALAPGLVATALALPRLWDAFSDPMMGVISDRTRFAAGRRRPYLLWGTPLLLLSFVLLWHPFFEGSSTALFTHLLLANLFFTTAITIVGVPYMSLGGELSEDYDERTSVFTYSQGFAMLGSLVGMCLFSVTMWVAARSPGWESKTTFAFAALLLAAPTCALMWVTFALTRGADRGKPVAETVTLREMLRTALANRPFRWFAASFIIMNAGMMLVGQLLPFLVTHWVGRPDLLSAAFAVYIMSVYIGFPFWRWLGKSKDKKHVLTVGFTGAGIVYGLSFFLFQPGGVVGMFVWAFLIGVWGAAGLLFPFSMVADIADEDELRTGARCEGIYYGAFSFIGKLAIALGSLMAGIGLELAGYQEGQPPSADALFILRLVFVIPVVTFLAAAIVIRVGYPLTRQRATEIRAELTARASSQTSPKE